MTDPTPRIAKHASESGHWYDQHGNQIESVPTAKGDRQIKPTLVHARKLDLVPGVTTIMGCCDKPQLTRWKINQSVLAALTLPRIDGEDDAAFVSRVIEDGQQQAAQAAEEGSRVHAAIQAAIQGSPVPPDYREHVEGAMSALDAACGPQGWRSEVSCVSTLGYGTKADLLSDSWLIDFKGKDGDESAFAKLKTFDEHPMQLGATRNAANAPTVRCGICFFSRTVKGLSRVIEIDERELGRGFEMFRALLTYWQIKNNHRPTWARTER